jgi:3-deoxy-manno-octulosonate cytidylyltransferase (CMP-KDO synthetase)
MKVVAVIPARLGATRLPGKPLLDETGKYLIQHVYECVRKCPRFDRVIVATDDERIVEAVKSFDGEVCMTRSDHVSGTDRVAEVAATLDLADGDVVLNVQGDEPEVSADVLEAVVDALETHRASCSIATAAVPFDEAGPRDGPGSPHDPARVKVVVDESGRALYFSRSLIPYPRDTGGQVDRPSRWLLHLGVYGFRAATLRQITSGAHGDGGALERAESLEQLRWLAAGHRIAVSIVRHRFVGIDTPEDYAAFVQRIRERKGACSSAPA